MRRRTLVRFSLVKRWKMRRRTLVSFSLGCIVMLLWCQAYGRIKRYKLGFFSLSGLRWLFIPVSFLGLDLPFLKVTVTSDGPVIAEDSEMSSDVDLALHSASVAWWCPFIPASFLGLDLPSFKVTVTSDGEWDSSVVRAPDSWLKGRGFESLLERRENFLLQGRLSVLTHFGIHSTPVLPQ